MSERARRTILAIGDACALVAFVVLGLRSHDEGVTAAGLARTALPLLAGWFATAAAVRLYARGGIARFLVTWAVGVTAGVAARALILGRPADGSELTFWAVTLAVTLAVLLAWRLFARLLSRYSPGTSPSRPSSRSTPPTGSRYS